RGNLTRREWLGRLGPHLTHFSLVLILAGSLIGNIWGFKGFVNIPQGDETATIFLKGTAKELGLDFTIRCEKFEMSYYPGSEVVREYLSDLVILEGGQEVLKKRIRVNDPLHYEGVNFYQSSYGFLPSLPEERKAELEIIPKGNDPKTFRIQLGEGETKQVQGTDYKVELAALIPDFSLGEGNRIFSRSDQPNNPAVQVNIYQNGKLSYQGWSFLKHPDFHGSKDDTYRVKFINYSGGERPYTGLMVVKDPGIPVVWTGFGLLTLGLIFAFFLRGRSTQKGGKDD
ncbi:MAG: cytochrome c biogenesis protein ResB, partial [Syntrophaceae bacterium]|nr:cytochrome c biogenesis protein ResB [Syntrophaceae bacterium]